MKVYLVGMPGSGKSTLGKKVAEALQVKFIDLDVEIERSAKQNIPEIFARHGEEHFRTIESTLLKKWSASNEEFVMATGGGAPCFHDGMAIINKTGLSIFIDIPIAPLMTRLRNSNDRPLLGNDPDEREKKMLMIAEVRMPCYRQAKVRLENPTVEQLLEVIHFQK
ncbi:MAG TPA: shikimate kinase [Chryseosolibacter sp.]|nr:shikimate kinase [Chryseosolibacter sp.]